MTFETIVLDQRGPVGLLGLNRPDKLNAINATMIDEINLALDQFEKDDSVHAVVVHGNGRAFCAGFDLQAGVAAKRETEAACASGTAVNRRSQRYMVTRWPEVSKSPSPAI
jgi:enoyl-CoA hydratase/carnithine racemase